MNEEKSADMTISRNWLPRQGPFSDWENIESIISDQMSTLLWKYGKN